MAELVPDRRRDAAFDAAVVLLATGRSVELAVKPWAGHAAPWHVAVTVAVQAAVSLTLVLRRRRPLAVAWSAVAGTVALRAVEWAAPGAAGRHGAAYLALSTPWSSVAAPFAVYAAVAFSAHRRARWLPVAVLGVFAAWAGPSPSPSLSAAGTRDLGILLGSALLGLYLPARQQLLRSLVERAEQQERERHLVAERARAEERTRLAAETHDVVSHRVSLMVLQAGALRLAAGDEARFRAAAGELHAIGCQALAELREFIGVLREEAPAEPAAGGARAAPLPDLAPLVAESASVGVPVELSEEGTAAPASPAVGRTAYRIVQEALTNVRKHAPGAGVRVTVCHRPESVRVRVRNLPPDGTGDAALTAAGSGTGLLGLRERVDMIGGTLHAGPSGDGGFTVEAALPRHIPTAKTSRHGE